MAQFNFDNLPNEAFLRQSQLINTGIVPFSASTLWRRIKEGRFPLPIKMGDQIVAWRVADIRKWISDPSSYRRECLIQNNESMAGEVR